MAVPPEKMPVSDLRLHGAATLKRFEHSRDPIVITQRGRAAAVLMGIEAYERAEEERLLLLRLAKGEQKIQNDQGFTLDEVLDEAEVRWFHQPA